MRKKIVWIAIGLFSFLVSFLTMFWLTAHNELPLARSSPQIRAVPLRTSVVLPEHQSEMAFLSEKEAFQTYHTPAFQGTIRAIRDIAIHFGEHTNYYDIAKIHVDKVYRGDLDAGETVTVLLPRPIYLHTWVEGTEIVSAMRAGMRGYFIPVRQYKADDTYTKNGLTLYYSDLANYSLGGGNYGVFLETDDGLLFNRETYATLSPNCTFEQAEAYLTARLKPFSE